MLQVVSGKLFDLSNVQETRHRGAFFTNYRMWGFEGLTTSIGTIYSAVSTNGPLMLTYELLERLPAGDGVRPGVMISTGGEALVNDFSAVLSFALNVTCTADPDLARRLVVDDRPTLGSSVLPRSLVPRIFDKEVPAKPEDEGAVNRFLDKIISLKRADFEAVMRSLRQYVVATHRLSDNPDLAYAVFVAALESLAQNSDGFRPTWDDLDEPKRLKLDEALSEADEAVASRVREAMLDIEHAKLKSRFIAFTADHIRPAFFREETDAKLRCIPRSDMTKALSNAYDVRSQYIHRLRPIPRHLNMRQWEWEYVDDGTGPLLNFAGLARLVRHVVLNFVDQCQPGTDEAFNLNDALPNIVTMRLASQYWIADAAGYSATSAKTRLAAHFQQLALAMLGHPEPQLSPLDEVMKKIEDVLPSIRKPDDRVPMVALYFSFNRVAPEEHRAAKWPALGDQLNAELDRPTISALFFVVLHGFEPEWPLEEAVALADRYFATKFHKLEMNVGDVVETILLLWLAERFRMAGDDSSARAYLARAVENSPSNTALRSFEAVALAEQALPEMNWRTLLSLAKSAASSA